MLESGEMLPTTAPKLRADSTNSSPGIQLKTVAPSDNEQKLNVTGIESTRTLRSLDFLRGTQSNSPSQTICSSTASHDGGENLPLPDVESRTRSSTHLLQSATVDILPRDIVFITNRGGKIYQSASLPLDKGVERVWNESLQSIATNDLTKLEGRNHLSLECLQTGLTEDRSLWKPSIVISCKDKSMKKKIENIFKNHVWQDRRGRLGLQLCVFIDPTLSILANANMSDMTVPMAPTARLRTIKLSIGLQNSHGSVCGAQIVHIDATTEGAESIGASSRPSDSNVVATMGGLVLVGGKLYGLTVGHPFAPADSNPFSEIMSHDISAISSPHTEQDESSSFENDISDNDESNDELDASTGKYIGGTGLEGPPDHSEDYIISLDPGRFQSSGTVRALMFDDHRAIDPSLKHEVSSVKGNYYTKPNWALVELENSALVPNSFFPPGDLKATVIEEAEREGRLSTGQVWVISGRSGVQEGTLNETSASVILGGSHFGVRQIQLQRHFVRGDSGAWVVRDGRAYGVIVAGSSVFPWAYMIPIEQVFEHISQALGFEGTSIPSAAAVKRIRQHLDRTGIANTEVAQVSVEDQKPQSIPLAGAEHSTIPPSATRQAQRDAPIWGEESKSNIVPLPWSTYEEFSSYRGSSSLARSGMQTGSSYGASSQTVDQGYFPYVSSLKQETETEHEDSYQSYGMPLSTLDPNWPESVSGIFEPSSINYPLRNPHDVSNLDPFQMRRDPRIFFIVGTVFKCLWTQPVGETTADTSGYQFSQNWLGAWMYSNTQRFVVVRPRHDQRLSFCLPIKTYGHKGTSREQSGHHAHAIIYTGPVPPVKLPSEAEFSKHPICMEPTGPTEILAPDSRLNFGKPTPVEHNLRVKYIGRIRSGHVYNLIRYYDQENNTTAPSSPSEVSGRRSSERRYSSSGYSTEIARSIPRVDERYEPPSPPRRGINMIQGYPSGPIPTNLSSPKIQQIFRAEADLDRGRANTLPAPSSRTVVKERRSRSKDRSLTDSALQYSRYEKYDKYGKIQGRKRY